MNKDTIYDNIFIAYIRRKWKMSILTTIKSDALTVTIDSLGAELSSVRTADGVERLWQGDARFWKGRAPCLFPIVGALRNKTYTYGGKEYSLNQHGFARKREFILESYTENSATYLLESDSETLAVYPFEFELRIVYTVLGAAIKIDYLVDNKTDGKMYFSIGSHEGYHCPGGFENYSVIFDENETLSSYGVNGDTSLIMESSTPIMENEKVLKLKTSYFEIDALVFLDAKSRGLVIRDDRTDYKIRVDFPGFDTLLIWTMPGSEYLCIEPWCGAPDFEERVTDFEHKPRINCIDINSRFVRTHTITFLGK